MANGDDDDMAALRTISENDAKATNIELQKELAALQRATRPQLEALRPQLHVDDATFNQLVQAVDQATAGNIAIAEFTERLKTLGSNVLAVAQKASSLLPVL
jgi:hypothetical protein